MTRASWPQTWAAVADAVAARSACTVRQVGAVLVSADNRDHWVGYNGPPAGYQAPTGPLRALGCGNYCPQGFDEPRGGLGAPCVSLHAEVNARMQADRTRLEGGWAYVTAAPCLKCALVIASSGVAGLTCPRWEDDRSEVASMVRDVFRRTNGGIHINHEWGTR